MVTLEVKRLDCADHDPIEEWAPGAGPVVFWLVCHVGCRGSDSADMFTAPVVNLAGLHSPQWKQRARTQRDVPPIVCEPYTWSAVTAAVDEILATSAQHDWVESVERLRAHFLWEYEGIT